MREGGGGTKYIKLQRKGLQIINNLKSKLITKRKNKTTKIDRDTQIVTKMETKIETEIETQIETEIEIKLPP